MIGYSVLMTAGLAIWCIPTASLMNVRDGDYDHGGALLAFAGSVQLIWLLIVLVVLPIERTAAAAVAGIASAENGRRRGQTPDRCPASALRTRVVLPPLGDGHGVRFSRGRSARVVADPARAPVARSRPTAALITAPAAPVTSDVSARPGLGTAHPAGHASSHVGSPASDANPSGASSPAE